MNENNNLTIVPERGTIVSTTEGIIDNEHPNFIESNTKAVTIEELNRCIVPTFSDNSLTIAHQQFIDVVREAATNVFGELTETECRASHPIIGRVPSALHKKANELREEEKTLFYQRLAWCCHVKGLTREINGQTIYLCTGGVRAYNEDKLYARKSPKKFKVFVGWQVRVCSNLMLTCDGYSGTIALSRKMPRFFDWLQKSVKKQTIKSPQVVELCKLLSSEDVEVTTEYAIPLILGGYSEFPKDKIAGIIADDVIIWGATLQRISMQWWAFSGEVPYVIALFRGMNGVIASILESDSTIAMPLLDNEELEAVTHTISENIHSTSLPIDIEYPLIYSNESYETIKKFISNNCPSWIQYEVKSESYKDSSESFSVLLVDSRNDGYTNDHAKIRLFKKATGCCIEMIAPSYVNILNLKDGKLFDGDDNANGGLYAKAWLSVFNVLHISEEDGNKIFTTIVQNDQINQAKLSLLIVWAEYLYCLSAFVRNCHKFFPKEANFNIRKEDLAIILGKGMANIVFNEITNIISEKIINKLAFEPIVLQEYVNPEELRDIYYRKLATELKDSVSVDDNLDALYKVLHFSSDIYRSMNMKNVTGHHCIGESFESLMRRIEHKHKNLSNNDLFTEINKWVDVRIDECKLAPKYEIVMGSDNQRYFRRFFLCGSNKI